MTMNDEQILLAATVKWHRTYKDSYKHYSINDLGRRARIAPSYLSTIERGRTFPSLDILKKLAVALNIEVAELCDLQGQHQRSLELLGASPEEVIALLAATPELLEALDTSLWEYGRQTALAQPGRFYPVLLRAAQEKCQHHLDEVERQAAAFAKDTRLTAPLQSQQLAQILRDTVHCHIEERDFASASIRHAHSVWYAEPKRLLLNADLAESHKLLALGRELGYHWLKLAPGDTRGFPLLTPVRSFAELWSDFQTNLFSRALLMPRESMQDAMGTFFGSRTFHSSALLEMAEAYHVTPGLVLSRFADLLPQCFPIQGLFYLRCHRYGTYAGRGELPAAQYRVMHYLNRSSWPVIDDASALSAYACRRWLAVRAYGEDPGIQVGRFQFPAVAGASSQWLYFSTTQRLSHAPAIWSQVILSFVVDDAVKETVHFWDDTTNLPGVEVGYFCERCPLPAAACPVRATAPAVREEEQLFEQRVQALAALGEVSAGAGAPSRL